MSNDTPESGQRTVDLVRHFVDERVLPSEPLYYEQLDELGPEGYPPVLDALKAEAFARGLWNLFLSDVDYQGRKPLSTLDYAQVSEELGRVTFAAETMNCSAPDTGNMETLAAFGSEELKHEWLEPLLTGEIRSAFCMTEPDSASSDANNVALAITRVGDEYVLNGRKWFSTGARSPRCRVLIVMGRTSDDGPRHRRQSMLIVPRDTPGVELGRDPHVFGFADPGGHPEVVFRGARVPVANRLGEEGDGFRIAQARLGPGRVHHAMRTIGLAERALELMVRRSLERRTFGSNLAHKGLVQDWIAQSRIEIDAARAYVLETARHIDSVGSKAAATEIAGIKVATANVAVAVIDRAIQVHGAAGLTQFYPLAHMYALARSLRIADGPDEVQKMTIARREIRRYQGDFTIEPRTD